MAMTHDTIAQFREARYAARLSSAATMSSGEEFKADMRNMAGLIAIPLAATGAFLALTFGGGMGIGEAALLTACIGAPAAYFINRARG